MNTEIFTPLARHIAKVFRQLNNQQRSTESNLIMHLQYFPKSPEDFIGSARTVAEVLFYQVLRLAADPQPTAWLFHGPPGVGKSALAKALALEMSQHELAVEHVNGQSLSVEVVRHWREHLHYRPMFGKGHVKWVDEFELCSPAAQGELLSFLEDMPQWMAFIATTNENLLSLLPKLQSRFQPFSFEAVPDPELSAWLIERWQCPLGVAQSIVTGAQGDVRAALNDLESHYLAEAARARRRKEAA